MKKLIIIFLVVMALISGYWLFLSKGNLTINLRNVSSRDLADVTVRVCEIEKKIDLLQVGQDQEIGFEYRCEGSIQIFIGSEKLGSCHYIDGGNERVQVNLADTLLTDQDCKSIE